MNEDVTAQRDAMPALTGIRLPLALWVVAHHISGPGRMLEPMVGASTVATGVIASAWVALSVFFAISGFVLARRYRTQRWGPATLGRYAMARVARIYPVYVLSIVVLLPVIYETLQQDALSVLEGTGLLVNYVLLLQGWFWPTVNWNTPAWSLSSEVFFYTLAPVVVHLVRVPSWRRVIAATALACAVPPLVRLSIGEPAPKALLYLGDFLIGVASAGVYEQMQGGRRRHVGPRLYGVACAAGVMLLLVRDSLSSFMLFDSGVRIVSALLVTGLACGGGWLVRILSSPLFLVGGRASYAMYILHIPVLWYYRRFGFDTAGHPVAAAMAYVLLVVALSLIVARWYEAPANAALLAWWARRQQRVAPSAGPEGRPAVTQLVSFLPEAAARQTDPGMRRRADSIADVRRTGLARATLVASNPLALAGPQRRGASRVVPRSLPAAPITTGEQ